MTENMNEFEVTHVFDASIETLWKYFTVAEMMMKWWGPENFTSPSVIIDFRVGGKFVYCMRGIAAEGMPVQDFWNTGTYKEIIPMEKIVTGMSFADKDGNPVPASQLGMPGEWPMEVILTVTFEEVDANKTKVTVQEAGVPTEMRHYAQLGWEQSLVKIAEALV